jgi:hypothetical protein
MGGRRRGAGGGIDNLSIIIVNLGINLHSGLN